MTIIPDCLSFSTYPYVSARVLTGNRWSTEISVIQAGFIYSGTTYRGVGWREGKYSDQGPVRVGFLSPSPEGWPLTCLCNASFLGPRVLLRFLRSRDDASERFFLQTCPVVSGLQLCLRGTFERLGVPGDVRKGLSASWSHLCPHLPWTRRQSHVLTRAGGDGTLQQVGPLLGTPHGPPVPAPLFL